MKERTLIRRIVICLLITLASISFLAINILLPTFAESPSENKLQPKWFEFPLAYGPSAEVDIDKHRIVWSQYAWSDQYPPCDLVNTKRRQDGIRRNAQGAAWFICLFDTRTRTITPVVDLLTFSHWPRLDGDWLVWTAGDSFRDIWAKNLVTGQEIMLPGDLQPDNASIYQNRVVFKDFAYITSVGFAEKVMLFDLNTQESLTISVSPDHRMEFPDIFSDTVVWQQSPTATQAFDIIGYDLTTQTFFTVSDAAGDELHPRIDKNIVVWDWQGNIYGYNLDIGQRLTITQDPWIQIWPAISNDLIVWMDDRNGQWDIYGYDLALGETYRITDDPRNEFVPAVSGNLVAYDRDLNGAAAARKMTEFTFLPLSFR